MKNIFLFSILLTIVGCVSKSYAPYTPPKPLPTSEVVNDIPQDDGDPIYMAVETPPSFPGGMEALSRFYVNLKFPQEAKEQGIHGKVYAQFVVEKYGSLSNISIRRSVHPLLDNEALRFIKLMPKWIPGEQNRKKVRVKYIMPINFTLR